MPVPHADALRPQVEALAELGGVLTPVTDLLNTVLKADNGQISVEQATKLGDAVKEATAKITEEASAAAVTPPATGNTATTPSTTTGSATIGSTTTPSTPTGSATIGSTTTPTPSLLLTLMQNGDDAGARSVKAPADLLDDAIDALEKAIDDLIEAVTSGEASQVESTLPAVISGLVDAVAATMLDTELPAPDLAGLSTLPSSSQPPTS
ncbi:MAG: hypothetical protein ACJ736_41620 [Streptomyces sp.]